MVLGHWGVGALGCWGTGVLGHWGVGGTGERKDRCREDLALDFQPATPLRDMSDRYVSDSNPCHRRPLSGSGAILTAGQPFPNRITFQSDSERPIVKIFEGNWANLFAQP